MDKEESESSHLLQGGKQKQNSVSKKENTSPPKIRFDSEPIIYESNESMNLRRSPRARKSTILADYLKVKGGFFFFSTWNSYYVVLKKSCLVYKKRKADKHIIGFINLLKSSIWEGHDECGVENSIMIYHPLRKTEILLCQNREQMKKWIKELQAVKDFLSLYNDVEEYTSSDDEKEVKCCGMTYSFSLPNPFIHSSRGRAIDSDLIMEEIEDTSMNKKKKKYNAFLNSEKSDNIIEKQITYKTTRTVGIQTDHVNIVDEEN